MKSKVYYLAIGILLIVGLGFLLLANIGFISLGQPYVVRQGTELYPEEQPVAFVQVNVVPMDRERILEDQTVIVRDGVIERMGPAAEVETPADALVVDGQGGYLMPGLTDMHVHVKEENELLLLLAHGVTTVRDMWGTRGLQLRLGFPDQLEMRSQIQSGELLGPTLYTSGPVMEGEPKTNPMMPVIKSPEQAAASVRQQKSLGYDFIKVYDQLTPEVYAAILQTAEEEDILVVGHAPRKVGLDNILGAGQTTIEHLSGYIDNDAGEYLIAEESLAEYAVMTREAAVWICPTIGVYQKHVAKADLDALESQPEMAFVSPRMKILWRYMFRPGAMGNISYVGDYPARIDEMFTQMTRILHENGVGIILGTDAGNPYVVHGASLLDELDYLVAAGFNPYEALAAGTRNAADSLGRLDEFGTISEGKRADLILLKDNPLEDVTHVRTRLGVMVRGHWFTENDLQTMVAELLQSYSPSLLDRIWPLGLIALGLFMLFRRNVFLSTPNQA